MNKYNEPIAIIGAGGLGVCAALELAQRGFKIDLYEAHSETIRKATYVNEGKIHLGFIYAMDKDMRTAKKMIDGAVHFMSYLKRWIDVNPEHVISTPFYYCSHKASLLKHEQLEMHYKKCIEYYDEAKSYFKKSYLDLFDTLELSKLNKSAAEQIANPEYIDAVFSTSEHSVEPRVIAKLLNEALAENDSINLFINTKVESVSRVGTKVKVSALQNGGVVQNKYSQVINCSWNGLLSIDETMGIIPEEPWSMRYKFGNKILIPIHSESLPSCTLVQGPFGDTVNFKNRGAFVSWYPIGRTGWSEGSSPPDWDNMYSIEKRYDIFWRSFEELVKRVPRLKNLSFTEKDISPVGGVIYALGNTDVDNKHSKLHTRFDVGIRSFQNYHSVNTGKYTLIPLLAVQLADRIEGLS